MGKISSLALVVAGALVAFTSPLGGVALFIAALVAWYQKESASDYQNFSQRLLGRVFCDNL